MILNIIGDFMNKTFITKMPNHIGAFLKASKCLSDLGINITRVSYNKSVDSHLLFIDVEGDEESLEKATQDLAFSSPPSLEPSHPL